jgi:flagellar basal body-associated protein FliL
MFSARFTFPDLAEKLVAAEFPNSTNEERRGKEGGTERPLPQRLIMPVGLALLLIAGVIGGFFIATQTGHMKDASPVEVARAYWSDLKGENEPDPALAPVFVTMEPLVTNMRSSANSRLLQLSLTLRAVRKNEAAVNEMTPHIRDLVILYLRTLDENDIQGNAALIAFKEAISRRIAAIDPLGFVEAVYVDQFVVQ